MTHRTGCKCYLCRTQAKIDEAVASAKEELFKAIKDIADVKEVIEDEGSYNILIIKEEEFNKLKGDEA